MYPETRLREVAAELAKGDPVGAICNYWGVKKELAFDLAKLSLFDVVFLLDDSGSMAFGTGRVNELKFILSEAAFVTGLMDRDGFSVRFMNSDSGGDNIKTQQQAADLVEGIQFQGTTPLASSLKKKILDPFIYGPKKAGRLNKPVLVIIITDGEVNFVAFFYNRNQLTINSLLIITGANSRTMLKVFRIILRDKAVSSLASTPLDLLTDYFQVVSFQIAQVGNDQAAQKFLAELDNDPDVGSLIDCTSSM